MEHGARWDFHTRSDHLSTYPRCLPLAITGIALSQVCCCTLGALYWIILIYSSPEELGVCLWQQERKERMNRCRISTPGQEQTHLLQQSPIPLIPKWFHLQILPGDTALLSSSTTEAAGPFLKCFKQILLPQFHAPDPGECGSLPTPAMTHLSNIKSLAAEPSSVIIFFPTISEHPGNLLLSLGWVAQKWWGSLLPVAGENCSGSSAAISSTPHSYWGVKCNKWDSSLSVTISYSSSLVQGGCLSLKKCWECGMWV